MAQAILQMSCAKLRSAIAIGDEFTGDLAEMVEALEAILPFVEDAERRSVRVEAVRDWLMRVRDATYDISDMVDELQDTGTSPASAGMMTRWMLPRPATNPMANKIEVMKQQLRMLQEEVHRFGFMQSEIIGVQDEATPEVEEQMIVGRGDDKQRVMAALSANDITEGLTILPIYGLGAIGKTSLARMVYNDAWFREYYSRVWVHVSQEYDLCRIGESIISQLSGEEGSTSNGGMEYIVKRLGELLHSGMKVLVVLDDLWEEDRNELELLGNMLSLGDKGSQVIVIVTTRLRRIAERFWTVEPHSLNPLGDDMCWGIIKQRSRFEVEPEPDKQELEQIGREIARKCGGLPLAAQVLGGMLWYKDATGWAEAMNSGSWNYPHALDGVFRSLQLSYRCMPPSLRLCFAYCAIFPKGQSIGKYDLIGQWIALHFIEQSDRLSATQLGEQYIKMLLRMSFLQTTKSASANEKDDKSAILVTMHDLVHDFAIYVMGDELDALYGTSCQNEYCRYAVLTDFDARPLKLSSVLPVQIRVLRFLGCSKIELSDDSFSFSRCLRVLDLKEHRMQKLPDSICQLRHLGYLNLSGCKGLVNLPESFGRLLTLVHIDLSGCSGLVKLLQSFGKLINLVRLNLSGCSGLVNLPESFGDLINLLHVDLSRCSGLKDLPESFGNLVNLLHIDLSRCSGLKNLPESFGQLVNLLYLDLSFWSCFEGIPVLGGLTHLRHLNLSHPCCYLAQDWPHLEGLRDFLGKLTKLQYLNLSMCLNPIFFYWTEEESREYIECISDLYNLEHLDLSHNIFLFDIPDSLGKLNKLHTLDLSGCVRLKRVAKSMVEIKSLKLIVLRNCRSLESYQFVVYADDGAYSSSNLVQLQDVNLQELKISCLEKVKSTEEAQRIRLVEKQKLRKLELCWTVGSQGSVEDNALLRELLPPHSLQCLELHGYNGETCLPAWRTSSISCHLANLVEVTMEDFLRCTILPPLGLLPNLQRVVLRRMASITRIDAGDLSGGNRAAFHQLSKFTIDDMESLQELNTAYNSSDGDEFMFPAIDELVIQKCPKLSFRSSCPPRAQMLLISACDKVMSSLGNRPSSTCSTSAAPVTTKLVVESCNVPLGDWSLLHHLPGLCSLTIKGDCDHLTTSSPEIIRVLSSLHSLCFSDIGSLRSLPEYLGDLTSLRKLQIVSCKQLYYLTDSIQKLTNLKDLHISDCPELKKSCESEENKKMLAHIPNYKYEEHSTSKPHGITSSKPKVISRFRSLRFQDS